MITDLLDNKTNCLKNFMLYLIIKSYYEIQNNGVIDITHAINI